MECPDIRRMLDAFAMCALLPSALATSCTARVLEDAAAPAACASDDDCAAGFLCLDDVCAESDADPLPRETTVIGADGGVVRGPDGILLTVDAGALDGATAFTITTSSATLEYANFTPTTRLYAIEPTATFPDSSARVHIPAAEPGVAGTVQTLFLRPTPPGPDWEPVEDEDGDGTFALARTGRFGVGVAIEDAR